MYIYIYNSQKLPYPALPYNIYNRQQKVQAKILNLIKP